MAIVKRVKLANNCANFHKVLPTKNNVKKIIIFLANFIKFSPSIFIAKLDNFAKCDTIFFSQRSDSINFEKYQFNRTDKIDLENFSPSVQNLNLDKESILSANAANIEEMKPLQNKFYAEGKEALLIILQAMDAGGKDGAIKHVMTGLNPQGVEVANFKQPTADELSHDFLWRCTKKLPAKGKIGIFNRSYYEDVLIGKVHKLYEQQKLPDRCRTKDIIEKRYSQIYNFEKYLWENGTRIIKFFFYISKDEQKKRFLKRIKKKDKNWKLSKSDIKERQFWEDYTKAYQDAINNTSSEFAPWYVIPANEKWFSRYFVSEIIVKTLKEIEPQYPILEKSESEVVSECKKILENEEKTQ